MWNLLFPILLFQLAEEGIDEPTLLSRILAALFVVFGDHVRQRQPAVEVQRANWAELRDGLLRRGLFQRFYRMDVESFELLLELLRADMEVSTELASRTSVGPILPEIRLHCLIRFLAGGSYLDICERVGISTASFYQIVWETCDTIMACEDLEVKFPVTQQELQEAALAFKAISAHGVIHRCIGCIDGWLAHILTPSKREVGNVKSYFLGHYKHHGLNVQAVADAHCRFSFFAVAAPGSAPDRKALERTSLPRLLASLPLGYFLIGDCAYTASEQLIPVFGGVDRLEKQNDDFNFYASQCRIRVEMAFGLMTKKWGVLQRPLTCSLSNASKLLQTVAILHNYTINRRVVQPLEGDAMDAGPGGGYTYQGDASAVDSEEDPVVAAAISGVSNVRTALVERVQAFGLSRPPIQ
jgi:hypothetical protein